MITTRRGRFLTTFASSDYDEEGVVRQPNESVVAFLLERVGNCQVWTNPLQVFGVEGCALCACGRCKDPAVINREAMAAHDVECLVVHLERDRPDITEIQARTAHISSRPILSFFVMTFTASLRTWMLTVPPCAREVRDQT